MREDTPTRYSNYIAKKNRQRTKDDPPPPRQMSPYEVAPVLEPHRPARREQRKRDPDPSPEQPPAKKNEPAKPESERSPRKPQNNVPQKETYMSPKKSKPLKPILMAEAPQQKSEFGPTAEPDVCPESKTKAKSESKQVSQDKQHSRQQIKQQSEPIIEPRRELKQESKTDIASQDITDKKPLSIPLEKVNEEKDSTGGKRNPPQEHKDLKIVPVIIPRHPPKWFESSPTPSPVTSYDDMLHETDFETSSEDLDHPKPDDKAKNKEESKGKKVEPMDSHSKQEKEKHQSENKRRTVPVAAVVAAAEKSVPLPLKKEQLKGENSKNQDKKEECRKDARQENTDNLETNKNESTKVEDEEKETKNRQIKPVINKNSDKVQNTQKEKMEEKTGPLKKKEQNAEPEPEHKRSEEMHKTDPKVKGKTKVQETIVVESGTIIISSGPGTKEILKSAKQTTQGKQNNKEQEPSKAIANGKENNKIDKKKEELAKSKVGKENGPGVFVAQPILQEKKDYYKNKDLKNNKTKKTTQKGNPRTKLIQIQPKQTTVPMNDYDDDPKKKKVS